MTNIRQAKKLRSGLSKNRPKNRGFLKNGKKKINVLGNAIIAENWYGPSLFGHKKGNTNGNSPGIAT